MVYAILLAAGKSKRFNHHESKLLYKWKNRCLFECSLNTLIQNKNINHILIVIPNDKKFFQRIKLIKSKKVSWCYGDNSFRWKSLEKGMSFLSKQFSLKPNDIILTHDAARVNVNQDIINDNLLITQKCGYASTVWKIYDSICEINKQCIYIDRNNKYLVQTPQTFKFKYWKKTSSINATDLFTYLNLSIQKKHLVLGSLYNFKITTQQDLQYLK